jgi:DNA-damage-inducible protein J
MASETDEPAMVVKVPNAATRAAMAEADEILAQGRARFADGDDLIADLDG